MTKRYSYVDLFAGCGGLSEGFESSGHFTGLAHVEWDKAARDTLALRIETRSDLQNAERIAIRTDIQASRALFAGAATGQFATHAGLDKLVGSHGKVDIIIGGPPCQAYSLAGRIADEHGMQRDYRNYLFESYLEVVKQYTPRLFVFENVPGMLSAAPDGKPIVDRIRSAVERVGYKLPSELRNCLVEMGHYGLPQNRRRLILLGISADVANGAELLSKFYDQFLPEHRVEQPQTVMQAIGELPELCPLREATKIDGRRYSHKRTNHPVRDHEPRFHSKRDQEIFRKLAKDLQAGSPKFRSIEALRNLYQQETGRNSTVHKYHVLRPSERSNLIPAHLHKDGLRHIHFDAKQARSITVREAALLQGFPIDFAFCGAQGDRYKMIGNAVPPHFARKLALAIKSVLAAAGVRARDIRQREAKPPSAGIRCTRAVGDTR